MATCDCGAATTTEVQTGWDAARNCGIQEPVCETCYAATDEAARHRREHYRYLAGQQLGLSPLSPYAGSPDPVGELATAMEATAAVGCSRGRQGRRETRGWGMDGYSFERHADGRTILQTTDGQSWTEVGPREVVEHPKLKVPVFGVVAREFFLEDGHPVYDRDDLKIAALIGARRPDGVEMLRAYPAATIEDAQAIVTQQLHK